MMDDQERDIEVIALLSNISEDYTYVDSDRDIVKHQCAKTGEEKNIPLIEVEYFRDGHLQEDRANFCEHCNTVFVYKPATG